MEMRQHEICERVVRDRSHVSLSLLGSLPVKCKSSLSIDMVSFLGRLDCETLHTLRHLIAAAYL